MLGRPAVILSDVGGVLIEDHWGLVAKDLAKFYGMDAHEARATLYELCRPLDLGSESLEDFHRAFTHRVGVKIPWKTFEEMVLVRGLKVKTPVYRLYQRLRASEGVRFVAVSNIAEVIWRVLDGRFRLSAILDAAVLSSQLGVAKPDPRIYEAAIRAAGEERTRCLFLDDSLSNVVGAKSAGIPAFRVSGEPEQLQKLLARFFPSLRPRPPASYRRRRKTKNPTSLAPQSGVNLESSRK